MVVGLPGNKSPYSNRLTLVFQSLRMMYDYKLNLVVRTPRACPWESSDDEKHIVYSPEKIIVTRKFYNYIQDILATGYVEEFIRNE